MKKYITFIFCLALIIPFHLHSQFDTKCGHDHKMEKAKRMDLDYAQSLDQPIPEFIKGQRLLDIITIPVHVIIVHPPGQPEGTGDNLSMNHILSQIDVLNEDFRRLNDDASNTPPEFPAADAMIEFCLATVDPDGNDTDGVTRYGTNQNLNTNEMAIKSATGWDRNEYLNVWVGPNLPYLGWAYLPTTSNLPNATLDGIVVLTGAFGGPGYGTTNNYDLGRTATHEIGHYLGLRHVWGSGGCSNDDGMNDTPIQSGSNFGCPAHPSPSCGNAGDMFMNYMDYVDDDCMNAFTEDQADYMNLILNTSRSSLLDAANTNCDLTVPLSVEIISQVDVLCFGENTGSVTVQATGGTGGYMYAIDGGPFQSSNVFNDLSGGMHIIEAQDDGGSSVTIDVVINEPPLLVPNIDSQMDVTCFGDANGLIIASAFGGTPAPGGNYLYSIDGINFTQDNVFTNLTAGVYTITVQDNNLCEASMPAIINSPEELISVPEEINHVTCNGDENGLIALLTIGGTPVYSYSIDQINFQPEHTFFNLAPGDYIATTVDANGCISEFPFTISEPDPLELIVAGQEDVLCFDEATGSIALEAVGGTVGYQYSLDDVNYQDDPFFDGLAAGSYTLHVLDANNCSSQTETELEQPDELIIELLDQTNVDCFGESTATLTVNAVGGTEGYTFTLDDESIENDTAIFENLAAGFHTLTLEDANACETLMEIEIIENSEVELETVNVEDVSCFDGNDGMIEVLAFGGEGDFTYSINGGDYVPESVFNDLQAGSHTIFAQDLLGCETSILVELIAPDEINTQIDEQSNPACYNESTGSIQASATGGTGTIIYTLGNTSNTTGLFENLAAGDYTLQIEDENNCTDLTEIVISQPEQINVSETANTSVDCNGNDTGSFQATASGGTGNFEYTLDGNTNTSGEFTNLVAGAYEVIASDENGCTQSLTVDIAEPEALEASIESVTNINCAGTSSGAIQALANGGTGSLTFTLNGVSNASGYFDGLDQGSYTIIVGDENDCETSVSAMVESSGDLEIQEEENIPVTCFGANDGSVQLSISGSSGNFEFTLDGETNTTGLFENLAAGTYTAMTTDGEDCEGEIELTIEEPEELTIQVEEQQNIACYGEATGSVQILASGGTQSYTYSLSNESNDTGLFENLAAGDHEITATDVNNCQTTTSVTLEQSVELTAEVSDIQQMDCNGENDGVFHVTASGGSGGYQYATNGETNATGIFDNLSSGDYSILVSDENGCQYTLQVVITEPSALDPALETSTAVSCFGGDDGTAKFQATGGTGNLEFTLNNETNSTGSFENLAAGEYELLVSDENGCTASLIQSIDQPAELQSELIEISNNNCFDEKAGTVQLGASGGTGNYQFSLGPNSNASGYFENLAAGSFEAVITDENGCTTTQGFEITQPAELLIEIVELQDIDCINNPVGSVQVQASGGTGDYEYQNSNEINDSGFFDNLTEGTIEISVTDANGCQASIGIEVGAAQEIEAEIIEMQSIDCYGENDGSILVNGIGGTGVYTYTFGNESNGSGYFENLPPGDYEVLVADENDCDAIVEFTIEEPEEIQAETFFAEPILCHGDSNGEVIIIAEGGTGDLNFTLGNQSNGSGYFDNLPAGDYTLIVSDENACSITETVSIDQPEELITQIVSVEDVDCYNNSTGTVNLYAYGGTGSYEFMLDNETNETGYFTGLPAGDYEGIVTDLAGCTAIFPFSIAEPEELQGEAIKIIPLSCFGETAKIETIVWGGTMPYSYTLGNETNTSGQFEDLEPGNYEIEVSDGNGCTLIILVEIIEPEAIAIQVDALQNVNCYGYSNGAVQLDASGGTPGYVFELDNESNTNGLFENLSSGPYMVTVTDAHSCTNTIEFEIVEPDILEVGIEEIQPVDCFGENTGAIQLEASGGTPGYTYTLGNETNTSGSFENLPAGPYQLVITDQNGCEIESIIEIAEPEELTLTTTALENDLGNNEGSMTLEAGGGTAPYMYSLDNVNYQSSNIFDNLMAGIYNVFVQDANGCITEIEVEIKLSTGFSDPEKGLNGIGILPNPFTDELYLDIDLLTGQAIQVRMFTIHGKELYAERFDLGQGTHNLRLDLPQTLAAGTYILSIQTEYGYMGAFRLVKQ